MIIGSVIKPVIGSVIGNVLKKTEVSYDYLITDDATWTSTFALGAATLSGKTIAVAPGSYTAKTISSFNPASTVTIRALNDGDKPSINRVIVSGSSKLILDSLRITTTTWGAGSNTQGAIDLTGTVSDVTVRRCDLVGNYRGTVGFAIDPTINTYPEYACISPVFAAGGAVASFEINRATVGDLLADGTYSMIFNNYGGVTFSVAPVATFTVSGGQIVSTNLTSGGASNGTPTTGSGIRTALITWTGQRRMTDWMPSGIRTPTATITGNMIFEDNTFTLFNSGFKGNFAGTANVVIRRNTFDLIYQDYMSFGRSSPAHPITVEDTFGTRPFSNSDAGDPHTDFLQLFSTAGSVSWANVNVERNILIQGNARGIVQGLFISDAVTGNYDNARIVGNAIINRSATNGITIDSPRDGYIYRNLVCRFDPTDAVSNFSSITMSTTGTITGQVFVGDNILEAGLGGVTGYASTTLGLRGSTIPYANVFANHTGARTNRAEVVAAYAPKIAYAGKGPFADTAYIDHVNFTTNRNMEPSYVRFSSISNQSTSTVVTSNWSRVRGGVNGRAISVTGGEYRVADDDAGTNATAWGSTAGTVDLGKYVQVRHTTGSTGSTTITTTLSIGLQSFSFQSSTTPATSFSSVSNGGTAWSRMSNPANSTGNQKLLIAFRYAATANSGNILAHDAALTMRIWFPTTTTIRAHILSSATCNLRPFYNPPLNSARTHIISLDFTSPVDSQGCFWATDLDGVLLNNEPGSGGVFATIGGTRAFGISDLSSDLWGANGSVGLFAEGDGGGGLLSGSFEFFWMDWGDATYTLPDITEASVRNLWTADNIGANGQGPTGSIPRIYYTGNAAGWNAGLSNLGSLTLPLDKQAGTYV
jgi:hypothetical protein